MNLIQPVKCRTWKMGLLKMLFWKTLETVKRSRPENMTVIFEKFQIYPIMLNSMRITTQPLLNHDKLAVMAELAMYIQRFNGSNLKSIIQICDFIA